MNEVVQSKRGFPAWLFSGVIWIVVTVVSFCMGYQTGHQNLPALQHPQQQQDASKQFGQKKIVLPAQVSEIPTTFHLSIEDRYAIKDLFTNDSSLHLGEYHIRTLDVNYLTVFVYASLEKYSNDLQIARGRNASQLSNEFARRTYDVERGERGWRGATRCWRTCCACRTSSSPSTRSTR